MEDLNIVSIAPAASAIPQLGAKKKKKNNKYERRRQKAKRAKQEAARKGTDAGGSDGGGDGGKETTRVALGAVSPPTTATPVGQNDERAGKPTTPETKRNLVGEKPSDTEPKTDSVPVSKKARAKRKGGSVPEIGESNPPSRATETSTASEAPSGVTVPSDPSDTGAGAANAAAAAAAPGGTGKLDDDEERAKYMAEFHARPMELDRRSGARSATIVSRESSHLFGTDAEDNSWESLNIYSRLLKTLRSDAFGNLEKPTTIQLRTIRAFQESMRATGSGSKHGKKNVLVHSETGSGKTLAYLLPIVQSLAFGNKFGVLNGDEKPHKVGRSEMGCRCIILCPTRELATQTLGVLERVCQSNFAGWIVPGGLLGGDSRKSEKASLRKGLAIVVATPGRLLDHLHKTQSLALSLKGKLRWLVLDEADRLLDMGLGDQVRQIVQWIWANEACASHQQPWWRSVLVSATVTPSVQALAKERILCGDQEWIWVKGEKKPAATQSGGRPLAGGAAKTGAEDFADSTPRQLAQFHLTTTAKLRLPALVAFLVQRISKGERTVVFMGTCASVDFHYELFNALEDSLWDGDESAEGGEERSEEPRPGLFGKKARVFKLHGSVSHSKRSQTMKEFNGKTSALARADVLLTTDVAARGLNLRGVDWTVQYDPPCEISDYVHRVGRAARGGKAGHSLLFLLPSERKYLEVLATKGIAKMTPVSLSGILNQAAGSCKELTREGSRQQGEGGRPQQGRGGRSGEHFAAEVQRRLEDCVTRDDAETRRAYKASTSKRKQKERKRKLVNSSKDGRKEGLLLEMARSAFVSFLRAYSTKKEPIVRSIFSSRALHFGHIAKSFALKEPPKALVSKQKSKREQLEGQLKDEKANLPRSLEFGKSTVDLDELIGGGGGSTNGQTDAYFGEDDEDEYRSKKRRKQQPNGKSINAKALLLENAAKMQNNLMDMM